MPNPDPGDAPASNPSLRKGALWSGRLSLVRVGPAVCHTKRWDLGSRVASSGAGEDCQVILLPSWTAPDCYPLHALEAPLRGPHALSFTECFPAGCYLIRRLCEASAIISRHLVQSSQWVAERAGPRSRPLGQAPSSSLHRLPAQRCQPSLELLEEPTVRSERGGALRLALSMPSAFAGSACVVSQHNFLQCQLRSITAGGPG